MTCGLLPSSMLSRPFFDRRGDWKMNFSGAKRGGEVIGFIIWQFCFPIKWVTSWMVFIAITLIETTRIMQDVNKKNWLNNLRISNFFFSLDYRVKRETWCKRKDCGFSSQQYLFYRLEKSTETDIPRFFKSYYHFSIFISKHNWIIES